jgi:hypothetical protein
MPKFTPLRDWATPSYDPVTGRTHSSLDEAGKSKAPGRPSNQREQVHTGGKHGAPGKASGWVQDGAGDRGRNKFVRI